MAIPGWWQKIVFLKGAFVLLVINIATPYVSYALGVLGDIAVPFLLLQGLVFGIVLAICLGVSVKFAVAGGAIFIPIISEFIFLAAVFGSNALSDWMDTRGDSVQAALVLSGAAACGASLVYITAGLLSVGRVTALNTIALLPVGFISVFLTYVIGLEAGNHLSTLLWETFVMCWFQFLAFRRMK